MKGPTEPPVRSQPESNLECKILLNLGQGDWQTGFPSVIAQLWEGDQSPVQFVGSLPPATHLEEQYQRWQQLYEALYGSTALWRRAGQQTQQRTHRGASDFEFDTSEPTRVSRHDFELRCQQLQTEFNQWLMAAEFTPVERRIRTYLSPHSQVRLMLTAHAKAVLRFPWRLWHLFDDYPRAELSVSLPTYSRSLKHPPNNNTATVKILAVLGNDEGIDVETDRQLLSQLPSAEVTLLAQPTLEELQHQLWENPWDVFFFAGHSTSQGQGYLQVNATESLTIEQLKYALQRSISNGLQLAILNSCDGLGLAWTLADLHLPQTIVMREPVSDAIAQQFLKAFLAALASEQSLYLSVREAREKLHGRTELGSYAAWLPVIVQNPSEAPPTWQGLMGQSPTAQLTALTDSARADTSTAIPTVLPEKEKSVRSQRLTSKALAKTLGKSVAIAVVVLGARWLGLLQSTELRAYDTLMKQRPIEAPDPRLVIVTVDGDAIEAQTSVERRGSLSDETLQAALSTLLSYEPRVIGLDLYRDFPAIIPALEETLALPEIVGICKCRDPGFDNSGIGSPPEMAVSQVGFSDFIEDTDGILRRQLLTLQPDATSPCTSPYGFAALMAMHYLRKEPSSASSGENNFQPSFTEQDNLKIGDVVFPHLEARTGGLQKMDDGGNQILLNYRARPTLEKIAVEVPLQKLLNKEVNPESIRDRMVIIGVTESSGDYWATPYYGVRGYGVQRQVRTSGVYLQAHMASQMISAVLDGRPLIWVLPQWGEALCIFAGAIAGSLVTWKLLIWEQWTWRGRATKLGLICFLSAGGLILTAWATLLTGGWLPLVPTLLTFGGGVLSSRGASET
ncbi:MAG: CHASE2 domain-containing protein [Cyanobacteria bacterium J06581_3]